MINLLLLRAFLRCFKSLLFLCSLVIVVCHSLNLKKKKNTEIPYSYFLENFYHLGTNLYRALNGILTLLMAFFKGEWCIMCWSSNGSKRRRPTRRSIKGWSWDDKSMVDIQKGSNIVDQDIEYWNIKERRG